MKHFSMHKQARRPTSVAAVVQKLGIQQVRPMHQQPQHQQRQNYIRQQPQRGGNGNAARYRLVRLIGQGAFGKAYLAHDVVSNQGVVIKKIRIDAQGPSGGATAFDDFRKEVECLRRLQHPHIVGYIDSSFQRPEATIVLEYAENGDLDKYLQSLRQKRAAGHKYAFQAKQHHQQFEPGGVPEPQVVSWFRQMLAAVAYMHTHKFLHRDIKSANIFLCGNYRTIKLGDFGIAKILDHTKQLAKTQVGTPLYMSPELCQGRPYSYKSDVWALGCVLYEMCTLKHPFVATNMASLVVRILRGQFKQLSASSGYSAKIRGAIMCSLASSPAHRLSAQNLLQKFQKVTASSSPPTGAKPSPQQLQFQRKHRQQQEKHRQQQEKHRRHHDHDHDHQPQQRPVVPKRSIPLNPKPNAIRGQPRAHSVAVNHRHLPEKPRQRQRQRQQQQKQQKQHNDVVVGDGQHLHDAEVYEDKAAFMERKRVERVAFVDALLKRQEEVAASAASAAALAAMLKGNRKRRKEKAMRRQQPYRQRKQSQPLPQQKQKQKQKQPVTGQRRHAEEKPWRNDKRRYLNAKKNLVQKSQQERALAKTRIAASRKARSSDVVDHANGGDDDDDHGIEKVNARIKTELRLKEANERRRALQRLKARAKAQLKQQSKSTVAEPTVEIHIQTGDGRRLYDPTIDNHFQPPPPEKAKKKEVHQVRAPVQAEASLQSNINQTVRVRGQHPVAEDVAKQVATESGKANQSRRKGRKQHKHKHHTTRQRNLSPSVSPPSFFLPTGRQCL